MSNATDDPRAAELLRRRALKNGAAAAPPTTDDAGPRKLSAEDQHEIRGAAAEHPSWSSSDLADHFEGGHGWRPSYQAIGRCLSEPAPRKSTGRKPGRPRARAAPAPADPVAEVEAIAAVSRALAPLTRAEVRRVLDWARARFEAEGGADR